MRKGSYNMPVIGPSSVVSIFRLPLFVIISLFVGVSVLEFTVTDVIGYSAKYTESAHGNSQYGVKRKAGTSSSEYSRGNCAHCHEQHASVDGSSHTPGEFGLFAPNNPTSQTDSFCFQCHQGVGSVQVNMQPNRDYGSTFGGGMANSTNIKDAFDFGLPNRAWTTGSSHNLRYIRNWWKATGGSSWVTDDTNACVVCHDPHTAQRNWEVVILDAPRGGVLTALRHPSAISAGKPRNLWGDELDSGDREVQSELLAGVYQAPFRASSPQYEPGSASQPTNGWGSNMPNYNLFCSGCHRDFIPNVATDADPQTVGSRNLYPIDWSSSGNSHGGKADSPDNDPCTYGSLKPPYDDANANYVLSCTDCHEPHGSTNAFLLRTVVNGKKVPEIKQWIGTMESEGIYEFCTACHNITAGCGPHQFDVGTLPPHTEFGCGYCHWHMSPDF